MPAFMFKAKFQKCIQVACDVVHYYDKVGWTLTPTNMMLGMVLNNYNTQLWELKDKQKEEAPK
eukprot:15271969-Ditylum_brightwellii.AAC.1